MTWRPITLTELQPMQTIRVNGRLAMRIHELRPLGAGVVQVTTDLGETISLTAADQLLRLDKGLTAPEDQGEAREADPAAALPRS
ncbi:hypothetical protein [Deinococcus koreensis]|uniref:Uncharacterized protein n=1 Tax=Deinococcus koreensis TaxID=2054903 RepID=A0A2K3USH6_9DEIO|nr:hypothetical protein [Deinococcus koreensis]PNY79460.1 hypothetical protein CVO96_18655 [Deinococcus koreensis]